MAASNRQIKRDASGQPTPQVFDEVADEYQVAKGTQGRQHAILYTAAGEPVDLAALVADMAATKVAAVATQAASEAVQAALEGTLTTQVSGSNGEIELQGPIAEIPAADSVPQNSTYFALDTGELLWTDGETWRPVGGGS